MDKIGIFIIRAVMSVVFAFIITRFFHPEMSLFHIAGISILLMVSAYLAEYLRNRKQKP